VKVAICTISALALQASDVACDTGRDVHSPPCPWPSQDRMVRSPTVEFALAPGAPEALCVEGPSAQATSAAVSNGAEQGHRWAK
jgi:hypothetical protein